MKILERILDLIYPPKCIFCEKVLKSGQICFDCKRDLPYTVGEGIRQKFAFVDACYSPFYYEGNVRESVLRYKFLGHRAYCTEYGRILSEFIDKNLDCGSIDVISWVPLGKKRMRDRGYNQSELIAREISERLGLESFAVLKKIRDNMAQSKTATAAERAKNVSGAYMLTDTEHVRDKCILLIDDVVTTGSTLSECARVIKKAGAKRVFCATVARHKD